MQFIITVKYLLFGSIENMNGFLMCGLIEEIQQGGKCTYFIWKLRWLIFCQGSKTVKNKNDTFRLNLGDKTSLEFAFLWRFNNDISDGICERRPP